MKWYSGPVHSTDSYGTCSTSPSSCETIWPTRGTMFQARRGVRTQLCRCTINCLWNPTSSRDIGDSVTGSSPSIFQFTMDIATLHHQILNGIPQLLQLVTEWPVRTYTTTKYLLHTCPHTHHTLLLTQTWLHRDMIHIIQNDVTYTHYNDIQWNLACIKVCLDYATRVVGLWTVIVISCVL